MNIIDNWIKAPQKTAIFTLSWYWACAVWENVQNIFETCAQSWMSAFTITKPGHDERKENSNFSLTQLEAETVEALDELKRRGYTQIVLIGNSISSLPIINASKKHEDIVQKLVLVAPVLDLAQTIRKKVKLLAWVDLPTRLWDNWVKQSIIPPQIIPQIAQWVTLEEKSFVADIWTFWWRHSDDIATMFPSGVPIEIYSNPWDKIIWPWLVTKVAQKVRAYHVLVDDIPWDTSRHYVDASIIIDQIIWSEKNILQAAE